MGSKLANSVWCSARLILLLRKTPQLKLKSIEFPFARNHCSPYTVRMYVTVQEYSDINITAKEVKLV